MKNLKKSLKEGNYVVIKLPHAPLSDARNLIVYDKRTKKIRIITQKALLSLPSVNSIGQSKGQICGICYDGKNNKMYFQNTKKEIFEYKNGLAAKLKFLEFNPTEEISSLSAFDNTLFYISNHEQFRIRKTNSLHFFHNKLFSLPKKSTAMLVDDSVIYIGVRDSLLRINLRDNRIEPLIKNIRPYVTRLKKHGDSIVVSTLNDGLLFLHNGNCRKTIYEDVHFQNDFAFTNESIMKDSILILNNHYLRFYSDTILQDSVALRGYERLLFSPQKQVGVAIKRSGVQYFILKNVENSTEIRLLWSESRPISPDGCMIISDTLFLAADEGMLKTPLAQDKLPNYFPVDFDLSDIDETKTVALVVALVMALVAAIVIFIMVILFIRKKQYAYKLKKHLKDVKESFRKKEEETKTQYKHQMDHLKNEMAEIEAAIGSVNESLIGNNDYNNIKNTIEECKRLLDSELLYALDASKINEISKRIQESKVRLNEMLIISLNKIWEKVSRYCNKDNGIADNVRKAINDGDLNARIEQIKKCEDYLDKIIIIKKYKAISSLNIEHFCNEIKIIVHHFDALKNDKGVDWESLEDIYHRLCNIEISERELKDCITNLEQEITMSFLYMEQIKQREIELNFDLVKRLIDVSKRKKIIQNKTIRVDEINIWNDICNDEKKIGKALLNDLKKLNKDNPRDTKGENLMSYLMKIVVLNDRLNMSFLLILIYGMIDCYRKENGKDYLVRQDEWSKLINDAIYQFFIMVDENGTDKEMFLYFGGKEIITNHGRKKEATPMVTYPYKILALTLAIGKIIPNKDKQDLRKYLGSPTSWYNDYQALIDRWKKNCNRMDCSALHNNSSSVIVYYLRKLVY